MTGDVTLFVFVGTLTVSHYLASNAARHPIKLFVDEVAARCGRRLFFLPLFGIFLFFHHKPTGTSKNLHVVFGVF